MNSSIAGFLYRKSAQTVPLRRDHKNYNEFRNTNLKMYI